jgi:hypothetical protein
MRGVTVEISAYMQKMECFRDTYLKKKKKKKLIKYRQRSCGIYMYIKQYRAQEIP